MQRASRLCSQKHSAGGAASGSILHHTDTQPRQNRFPVTQRRREICCAGAGSVASPSGATPCDGKRAPPPRAVMESLAPLNRTSEELAMPSCHELGFPHWGTSGYAFTSAHPIGSGQYGVVYRAQHLTNGTHHAVKVMNKDRDDRSREEHLRSIQQEVSLWRACQPCKHVVRIQGAYEDESCVYLVQQLCTGGDLRAVLQGGRLTEHEAAQVMRSVLEVIHTCHTQHHVYGDCKPANFLLLHPHRTTGCKEFPEHPAMPITDAVQQEPLKDGMRRHSDTIREHLLASFQLPSAPGVLGGGKLSPSPISVASSLAQPGRAKLQLDLGASAAGGDTAVATVRPQAEGLVGHPVGAAVAAADIGTAPAVLVLEQPQLDLTSSPAAVDAAVAAAAHHAATTTSHHAPGKHTGDQPLHLAAAVAAVGAEAPVTPSWMSLLTNARSFDPLEQWPGSGLGGTAAAGSAETAHGQGMLVGMGGKARDQCARRCREEMVVLATDFGCCQPLHASHKKGVIRSKRLGSPVYMAPELWQAGAMVGPAVDVWAAGVMLYQLLSGRYPFWPASPETIDEGGMQLYQVVCGIQSNPIQLTGDPWKGISRQCKSLIEAMLERQPGARISARAALRHPWLSQQLGYTPLPAAKPDPQNDSLLGSLDDQQWPQ